MNKKEPIVKNTEKQKEAIHELTELFKDDVPRCSEEYFRAAILPMLLSADPNVSLEPWMQVSDNVKRPIDVFRGSQLLFRCPPISRRFNFKKANGKGDTMFEHVAKSLQKDDVVPSLGQRYINNAVQSKTQIVGMSESEKDEWRVVLNHFGVLKGSQNKPSGQVVENDDSVPEDESDFIDDYELA